VLLGRGDALLSGLIILTEWKGPERQDPGVRRGGERGGDGMRRKEKERERDSRCCCWLGSSRRV
jgi:hypothetical protein